MNRTNNRIFKFSVKEGTKPKNVQDNVDSRLFTGENKLHAVWDLNENLWHLEYDFGSIPQSLKQKFTKYSYLERTVREYFIKRNVIIKEVGE